MERSRRALPFGDARHLAAHRFLVEEAALLDTGRFEEWLELLHPSITYLAPARVTAVTAQDEAAVRTIDHFAEDHHALRKRVERLMTRHAWTEDPQSRTRHHVGNVLTFAIDEGCVEVESALLLFRSRGDRNEPSIVSAGRTDRLVEDAQGWRLARRHILLDESVLRMQNLAVFL